MCFNLPAAESISTSTLCELIIHHQSNDVSQHDSLPTELGTHRLLKQRIPVKHKTNSLLKRECHSLNTWMLWVGGRLILLTACFFRPAAVQLRLDTRYLSMESTISSMHPLILFCASKCVMFSVESPSIAKIMSPMHRLAWAALLPGVTYNTGDPGLFQILFTTKHRKQNDQNCEYLENQL